ncbi:hypothetical protein HK097_010059 [Rhizophlyctis rosea]|uniref:cellulase n=1 Tax=Rhizophlyctis rosea TaxID=64517 RepID=A0AAD5X431_9FUNG|nr:hypothetical protein HK097_010059 [Rhizophlyctis rosea]
MVAPLLLLLPLVFTPSPIKAATQWTGMNQAGMEFCLSDTAPTGFNSPGCDPGTMGEHYFGPANSSLDNFRKLGSNVVRVPLSWERLQPVLNGPLTSDYAAYVDSLITRETTNGSLFVIDIHNYGRYKGLQLGSVDVPYDAFYNLWEQLANKYKGNEKVVFGLMNQPGGTLQAPAGPSIQEWWGTIYNTAIQRIRATGATNRILVQATCKAFGQNFFSDTCGVGGISNAEGALSLSDPLGKTSIDIHQFINTDRNGGSGECTHDFIPILNPITTYLRAHQKTAWLGEFGVGWSDTCIASLSSLMTYLSDNSDVWPGWIYWVAGPAWGDPRNGGYAFSVEPPASGVGERPQVTVIKSYFVDKDLANKQTNNTVEDQERKPSGTGSGSGARGRVVGAGWMVGMLVGVFGVVALLL